VLLKISLIFKVRRDGFARSLCPLVRHSSAQAPSIYGVIGAACQRAWD